LPWVIGFDVLSGERHGFFDSLLACFGLLAFMIHSSIPLLEERENFSQYSNADLFLKTALSGLRGE
jgi:hypothetical protein